MFLRLLSWCGSSPGLPPTLHPSWYVQQPLPSGQTCLAVVFVLQVHLDWLVPPNLGYRLHPGQRYPLWAQHHQAEPGCLSTTQCAVWLVSSICEMQGWCYPTGTWVLWETVVSFQLGWSYLYLCEWCEAAGRCEIGAKTFCLLVCLYMLVNYQQESTL